MSEAKIENLDRQDAEELTAEQAEEARGGVFLSSHGDQESIDSRAGGGEGVSQQVVMSQ